MKYSVIMPGNGDPGTYFIVPLEREDEFVDIDCDRPEFQYAPLDDMLRVSNEYAAGANGHGDFETEHYRFTRDYATLRPGMIAKAVQKEG